MAQDPRQFGSTEPLHVVGKQSENATNDFDKARLAANSIHSSFASEERKAELLAELNGREVSD